MTDTIFGDDQSSTVTPTQEPPQVAPVVTPTTPTIPQELLGLVGEGKKYRSVEDALRSLPHAQTHISTLEAENTRMKEELAKRATAAELLEDIRNSSQQQATTIPAVEVNQDVVSAIVKQQLALNTQETLRNQNTDLVVNAFRAVYGDKAKDMFSKVSADNGMTVAQLEQMVSTTPTAVLNLAGLGAKKAPASNSFTTGTINTQTNLNTNPTTAHSKVINYGSSKDIAEAFGRAREIVNNRQNS